MNQKRKFHLKISKIVIKLFLYYGPYWDNDVSLQYDNIMY